MNDPHPTCLGHNTLCFINYEYDPTHCDPCQQLFTRHKAGDKLAKALFTERLTGMRRSLRQAVKSGRAIPTHVMTRFQNSGGLEVFKDSARHLDPRVRSRTPTPAPDGSPHRPRSSTPPPLVIQLEEIPRVERLFSPSPVPGPSGVVPPPPSSGDFSGFTTLQAGSAQAPPTSTTDSSTSSSSEGRESRSKQRRKHSKKASKRKHSSPSSDSSSGHRKNKAAKRHTASLEKLVSTTREQFSTLETNVNTALATLSQKLDNLLAGQQSNIPQTVAQSIAEDINPADMPHPSLQEDQYYETDQEDPDNLAWEDEGTGYDPYHPELTYQPSPSTSTLAPTPSPTASSPNFYFFPDTCTLYEHAVVIRDHEISVDSGELEFSQHNGIDTFRPVLMTEAVKALMDEACLVVPRKDLVDSKQEHFKSLLKVVNMSTYQHFGFRSSNLQGLTFTTNKPSRFIESIKEHHDTTTRTHKVTPFSLLLEPGAESQNKLLAFASAPKLGKDCHKLSGILGGKTREIPETLRSKDYEIRQQLSGLLTAHEFAKLSSNITSDVILKRLAQDRSAALVETHVKSVERINNHLFIPIFQTLITNTIGQAKQIRYELREKATSEIKTHSIKTSLKEGSLLSLGLFDEEAVRKAEECYKSTPPSVHIHAPGFAHPFSSRPRPSTSYGSRGPSRGSYSSFRGKGRQGSYSAVTPSSQNYRAPTRARGNPSGPARRGSQKTFTPQSSGFSRGAPRGTGRYSSQNRSTSR